MTSSLYAAIAAIRLLITTRYEAHGVSTDSWPDGPNPLYHQTTAGLLLAGNRYESLNRLYTPLGELLLFGASFGGGWASANAEVLELLGAECILESADGKNGPAPALYTIARVGDIELPTYAPRERGDYIPYAEANTRWAELGAGALDLVTGDASC